LQVDEVIQLGAGSEQRVVKQMGVVEE